MPSKKKTKSQRRKSKTVRVKAKGSPKKRAVKTKSATKSAKQKSPPKKARPKNTNSRRKRSTINVERDLIQELQQQKTGVGTPSRRLTDFQGLPETEDADSESVDELVEEGNIFEAGAVAGVEEADDAGEREVHTHEVPEDDVPEEYLDKD